MTHPLIPCVRCVRHLRADARECPFCAAPQPPRELSDAPVPSLRGMSRSAIVALGATLALAGCKTTDHTSVMPVYGAPIPPQPDVQAIAQPYGVPIPPPDVHSVEPVYGAPIPPPDVPVPPQTDRVGPIRWELSTNVTTLTMAERGRFRITIRATNTGRTAVNPGRDNARIRMNGRDSMALDMGFGNGLRGMEWETLPAGRTATDARDMGTSLLTAPGEYTFDLVVSGQRVSTARVHVTP